MTAESGAVTAGSARLAVSALGRPKPAQQRPDQLVDLGHPHPAAGEHVAASMASPPAARESSPTSLALAEQRGAGPG